MSQPVNPYIAGAPLRGDRGFFGRQDTLAWVQRELRNLQTNALVLFGQRRIGKTTLLLQLARNLPKDEFIAIYFDLQDQAARPLGQTLCDIADILCERADLDLGKLGPYDDQGRYFQREFLPRFYEALGEKRRPVFLLDEFDVLDQSAEAALPETATAKALFPLLRRLMTTDGHSAFVFVVGRRAEDLSIDFSATFKASLVREIWVLDDRSAEQLVRQAEANGTLKFTNEAVRRVSSLTNYHPYLTQLLCQRIWELAYAENPTSVPKVDGPQVEAALESSLEAGNQALDWLWNGLNPAEKIYAAALAEIAGENETIPEEQIIEVLATHAARLRTREIELAPRDLVKRHVLDVSGERSYRFAVELFRRWVHKNKPLMVVKDEVDRIDPMADRLFVFGDGFYDARNWEKAAQYFREALGVNPRHFRARLYLGETLLELGKVEEAIVELDQALVLDREEARLPLARAWLAKAEKLKAEDNLDELMMAYERVLELSPRESLAIQGRNAVWVQRAQQAEADGDLAAALEAYRQAGDQANIDRLNRQERERLLSEMQAKAQEYVLMGMWDPAISTYTEMIELALDESSRQAWQKELGKIQTLAAEQQERVRLEAIEKIKTQAQEHEQHSDWESAVRAYEQLGQMEGEDAWLDPLEKARNEQELVTIFEQGRQALLNEDWKDAQSFFARLIQARPDYNRNGVYAAALLQDAIQHRNGLAHSLSPRVEGFLRKLSPGLSGPLTSIARWFVRNGRQLARLAFTLIGFYVLALLIQYGIDFYNYNQPALSVGDVKTGISVSEEPITEASLAALGVADSWYFTGSVEDIAISPDAGTMAVAFYSYNKSMEHYAALIDLASGTVQQIFEGHTSDITSLEFSPTESLLATGSHDYTVKLWDLSGGLIRTLEGHGDWVQSVAFSPDGSLLASASDDKTVRIWQVSDGSLVHTLEGPGDYVWSVDISPDGSLVAAGSGDSYVWIWQIEDGSLVHQLEGHTQGVRDAAFSPDGSLLASASVDGTVNLWQMEDGNLLQTLIVGEPGSGLYELDFSPDGSLLAVASVNGSGIWDVADGEHLTPFDYFAEEAEFSSNGRFLISAYSGIDFWMVDEAELANLPTPTAEPTEAPTEVPTEAAAVSEFGRCGDPSQLSSEISFYSYFADEIDPSILEQFEAECGVKVNLVSSDVDEDVLATLQSGEVTYDVVKETQFSIIDMIAEGLLMELDYELIPNIENMESIHLNQFFDPDQKYTVPYLWSTYGFAVDTEQIPEYDESWSMLFDSSSPYCGSMIMSTGRRTSFAAALIHLGYSVNETDPAHLEEAYHLLLEQSKCVEYDSGAGFDRIVSGEMAIVHSFSKEGIAAGDPDQGGRDGIVYVIPREGTVGWQDTLVVPANAPNPYTAMVFINYLSEPEISAQSAAYAGFSTPSIAAREFVDPDLLANPGLYPEHELLDNIQWMGNVGDAIELYNEYWAEVTGQQ